MEDCNIKVLELPGLVDAQIINDMNL